jgi:hypothetical protein
MIMAKYYNDIIIFFFLFAISILSCAGLRLFIHIKLCHWTAYKEHLLLYRTKVTTFDRKEDGFPSTYFAYSLWSYNYSYRPIWISQSSVCLSVPPCSSRKTCYRITAIKYKSNCSYWRMNRRQFSFLFRKLNTGVSITRSFPSRKILESQCLLVCTSRPT